MESFKELGISQKFLLDSLSYHQFPSPSQIQTDAIPLGLAGKDLIAKARSGTGKTLAFLLIALQKLDVTQIKPQILIVTPTRELAAQIYDITNELTFTSEESIFTWLACGGYRYKDNKKVLRQGVHIVIGTPGRLHSLLEAKSLLLDGIQVIILDEVDQLIASVEVNALIASVPKTAQILAFSATYSTTTLEDLRDHMNHPIIISAEEQVVQDDTTHVYQITQDKGSTMWHILDTMEYAQAVIFTNRRSTAEEVAGILRSSRFNAVHITAEHNQTQRNAAMEQFRNHEVKILLATDLAARGIDILTTNLVINFDLPIKQTTYYHRGGRAGRFGAPGLVVTLLANESERTKLRNFAPEIIPLEDYNQDIWKGKIVSEQEDPCPLCETGKFGKHCHCQICIENYAYIVKSLK